MAHAMQLSVSSFSSSSSSCGGAIQAVQRRPGGCTASAFAAPICGRGPAGSAPRISLKNGLLPCDADMARLIKGSGGRQALGSKQAAGGAMVVQAGSITRGTVTNVRTEVEGLYTNVTLSLRESSNVGRWYTTPGQYAELLPMKSTQVNSSSFFISSAPKAGNVSLEFLINFVAGSNADWLTNSKRGDEVIISSNDFATGFNLEKLRDAESVLMFASAYGISPMRALIEKGFQANQRKDAILYTLYAPNQEPYKHEHAAWEQTGVTVLPFENSIVATNPTKTVVLMVAFEDEQEKLINHFEERGVPPDQILTLFDGIPRTEKSYMYSVRGKPSFLHMGERHVPFALKI